jgi:hypothetical protein
MTICSERIIELIYFNHLGSGARALEVINDRNNELHWISIKELANGRACRHFPCGRI